MENRTCSGCLNIKDVKEFSKDRCQPCGYKSRCKLCMKEKNNTYYVKTKEIRKNKRDQLKKEKNNTEKITL